MKISMDMKKFGSVYFIEGGNGGTYPYCHSIFIDAEKPILIDPSSNKQTLLELREKYPDLAVIHSHYHEDHLLYYSLFSKHQLWAPAKDAPAFSSIENMMNFMGVEDKQFARMWRGILIDQFGYFERPVDYQFSDGDVIDLGSIRITVIGLPGHTAGHCGFFIEPDDVFFMADISLTPFGPWYAHACSSIGETLESIDRVEDVQASVYITSHAKGIFNNINDELIKYKMVINFREEKIIDFLKQPRTIDEIVKQWIIFEEPGNQVILYDFAERGMILKHLERLIDSGEILKNNEKYVKI